MLPNKRMEYYMAQLTAHIAASAGAKRVQLRDYLFDDIIAKAQEASRDKAEDGAQILGAIAGGKGVVRLGLKKKLRMQKASNG